jgi:membrane fusion protein, multidrug efflux system
MDQRVSDERRREALPATPAEAGGDPRRTDQSWLGWMRQHRRLVLAMTVLLILIGAAIVAWRVSASGYISTDDAFIDARTVTISPQISGQITDVPVTDNALVEAGATLVIIDNSDYRAQVDQAKAQADQAQANIEYSDAQIGAQQARVAQAKNQVTQAQAAFNFAKQQDERYQGLFKKGSATAEQAQQYHSSYLQAQASLNAAQANATATDKQLGVLQSQKLQARAQFEAKQAALEQAKINLSRTVITAPIAGYVTQLTAARGNYAAPGQALMMFVPRDVWVTANFKETEISSIHVGASTQIAVDAYPGRTFQGHVASIQAGSGTAFSLLPTENATGNYVKIVQRVPVKIVFNKQPNVLLGPGMSVVPTVKVQ